MAEAEGSLYDVKSAMAGILNRLIAMDEVTVTLQSALKEEVLPALARFAAQGQSVHDGQDELLRTSDRVVCLTGHVCCEGAPVVVSAAPAYRTLFGLGAGLAAWWFARRARADWLSVFDACAAVVPFGLFFGRVANFINGELWGRPTDGPFGIIFCNETIKAAHPQHICPAGSYPRHPSQLYEAGLEGVLLFLILAFAVYRLKWLQRRGAIVATFLIAYGLFRLSLENVRNPDVGMPDFPFGLTMGMMLSTPMILVGGWLMWKALREPVQTHEPA